MVILLHEIDRQLLSKNFWLVLSLRNDLSADATVAGIVSKSKYTSENIVRGWNRTCGLARSNGSNFLFPKLAEMHEGHDAAT